MYRRTLRSLGVRVATQRVFGAVPTRYHTPLYYSTKATKETVFQYFQDARVEEPFPQQLNSELEATVQYLKESKALVGGSEENITSQLLAAIDKDPSLFSRLSRIQKLIQYSPSYSEAKPVRIAVTGGAGQIGYALLYRLASGQLLGPHQPVILQLLEVPQALKAVEGVVMELHDCAFPLLRGITFSDDPEKAFDGAQYAFLVGAQPRTEGMDRAQLMSKNAGIFSVQGKALDKVSNRNDLKVLVVGNPANTNCLIASANAPNIHPTQFSAMTRLDHNRGISQLADKLKVKVDQISKFALWGNHSDTQFPDVTYAQVSGKPAKELVDRKWLADEFIPGVAKRGSAIIKARGASSAASAANAAIDQMRDWALGTDGNWVSMAVWTGEDAKSTPYGVSPDLFYSFPVVCEDGKYNIVSGLPLDEDQTKRLKATDEDLVKEKKSVGDLAQRKSSVKSAAAPQQQAAPKAKGKKQ